MRRRLGWWRLLWRVPLLVTILAVVWWFVVRPLGDTREWVAVDAGFSLCGDGQRTAGCVIDGDTVMLVGAGSQQRRIRLTGFDAPEIKGACKAEQALARVAQRALLDWLNRGAFEWDGGADPARDRFGRELRAARRTGPDGQRDYLADTMIAADLARRGGGWNADAGWCD